MRGQWYHEGRKNKLLAGTTFGARSLGRSNLAHKVLAVIGCWCSGLPSIHYCIQSMFFFSSALLAARWNLVRSCLPRSSRIRNWAFPVHRRNLFNVQQRRWSQQPKLAQYYCRAKPKSTRDERGAGTRMVLFKNNLMCLRAKKDDKRQYSNVFLQNAAMEKLAVDHRP